MRVKICGVKDIQTIEASARAGADYLGFVVDVETSRRSLDPEQAKALISSVPEPMIPVAVIVPKTQAQAKQYAKKLGCMLQIHGLPALPKMDVPVIRAFNCNTRPLLSGEEHAVLFDSATPGSGIENDFSLAGRICQSLEKPMLLAGGLDQENVERAIKEARPFAVDVSTGIETDGRKDPKKIKEFIRRAKNAGRKIR